MLAYLSPGPRQCPGVGVTYKNSGDGVTYLPVSSGSVGSKCPAGGGKLLCCLGCG